MQAQLLSDVAFLRTKGFTRIELRRVGSILRACGITSNHDNVYFTRASKHRITNLNYEPDARMFDARCPANFSYDGHEIISPIVSMVGNNHTVVDGAIFVTDEKCYGNRLRHLRNIIPRCLARLKGYTMHDVDDDWGIAFTKGDNVCILPLSTDNIRYLKGFKRNGVFFTLSLSEFNTINVDTGTSTKFTFNKIDHIDAQILNPAIYDASVPSGYGFRYAAGILTTVNPDPMHDESRGFVNIKGHYYVNDYRCYFRRFSSLRNIIPRCIARLDGAELLLISADDGIVFRNSKGHYLLPLDRKHVAKNKHLPRRGIFFMLSRHCAFAT